MYVPCTVCSRIVFPLVILSTGIWVTEGRALTHRTLLGQRTEFERNQLGEWDVPVGAKLLLESRTSCGDPPPVEAAIKMAFLCDGFTKFRSCMNVSEAEPFIRASGCRGTECTMRMNSDDEIAASVCFFKSLNGIDIDFKNKTRKDTCGFDEQDANFLVPERNPVNVGPVGCVGPFPEGVQSIVWAECTKRGPAYLQKLIFNESISSDPFTCMISKQCRNGKYISEALCYSDFLSNDSRGVELADAAENAAGGPERIGFVVYLIGVLFIIASWWEV